AFLIAVNLINMNMYLAQLYETVTAKNFLSTYLQGNKDTSLMHFKPYIYYQTFVSIINKASKEGNKNMSRLSKPSGPAIARKKLTLMDKVGIIGFNMREMEESPHQALGYARICVKELLQQGALARQDAGHHMHNPAHNIKVKHACHYFANKTPDWKGPPRHQMPALSGGYGKSSSPDTNKLSKNMAAVKASEAINIEDSEGSNDEDVYQPLEGTPTLVKPQGAKWKALCIVFEAENKTEEGTSKEQSKG
ncbi:hypothetical protein POSPLADRAFT_1163634, partial [Postia placenta MAD-698-R-SB12]